jgi:hypothetical protein
MQTRVGLATAVMMAMALGHVRAGRIKQMRSLVQPIALSAQYDLYFQLVIKYRFDFKGLVCPIIGFLGQISP